MAAKAPGKPISSVKLLSPVARPSKAMAAPTNYKKHIEEMRSRTDLPKDATRMPPNIEKAGIFLKANSSIVGPSEGISLRFPDRPNEHEIELVIIIGKQGTDIPKDKFKDYVAGYALGLDMTTPRLGGPQLPQVDRRLFGDRPVDGDRRRDRQSGRRA